MGKLEIKKSIEVNTNAAKTWEIIGPNFLKISDWARGVNKSWENENVSVNFEKAPAGGRYCDVEGFGKFDERIIHYDNEKREISWSADAAKIPNFVSGLKNEIKVEEMNEKDVFNISTINGKLLLCIPESANADVEASSISGSISNDFGLKMVKGQYVGKTMKEKIGKGGAKISMSSISGTISLKKNKK